MTAHHYRLATSISLVMLIFLCLVWEAWLAPLRPGGSWLTLKAVFLLLPLFGILHGKRYTYQWSCLFIQFYLLEGMVRSMNDAGLSQWLAIGETVLGGAVFIFAILFVRSTRSSGQSAVASEE